MLCWCGFLWVARARYREARHALLSSSWLGRYWSQRMSSGQLWAALPCLKSSSPPSRRQKPTDYRTMEIKSALIWFRALLLVRLSFLFLQKNTPDLCLIFRRLGAAFWTSDWRCLCFLSQPISHIRPNHSLTLLCFKNQKNLWNNMLILCLFVYSPNKL